MLSDSSSFPQLVVVHSEHKMDVIKVECSSVSEDDPSSSHHQGQLINTNVTVLPLATPVFRAESHVSISGQTLCFVLLCLNTGDVCLESEGLWFVRQ